MTLVVEGRADTTGQDPQIVWKNLSSTATLTYPDGARDAEANTPRLRWNPTTSAITSGCTR